MKKTLIGFSIVGLICAGCNTSTTTTVKVDPANGAVTWSSHKNICFTNLDFTIAESNNVLTHLHVDGWYSYTDPAVLNAASAGDVAIINAASAAVQGAVQTGLAAAASGGGTVVVPAVKQATSAVTKTAVKSASSTTTTIK